MKYETLKYEVPCSKTLNYKIIDTLFLWKLKFYCVKHLKHQKKQDWEHYIC